MDKQISLFQGQDLVTLPELDEPQQSWPPPYTLKRSQRAKYIRLTIDQQNNIQIVLPRWASKGEALQFLEDKRSWVEKHLDKNSQQSERPKRIPNYRLPQQVHLLAIRQTLQVLYRQLNGFDVAMRQVGNQLVFSGEIGDFKTCHAAFHPWLRQVAQQHLTPRLQYLAKLHGFRYKQVRYRLQKTLWGSCTNDKHISLNCKLLFLPDILVDYVILHELCHTEHLDHSDRFWARLRQCHSQSHELDERLKQAEYYVPLWLI